jgi:hypothetical protein
MATWRHAFSLSKEELRDSEPPGTIRLVGMSQVGLAHGLDNTKR